MVEGLERFKEHFAGFEECYVLIGGVACDLIMAEAGLSFRATKDLDIVLRVEALDARFVERFWAFVKAGKYELQQSSTGKTQLYRFKKPGTEGFPFMLELFSREPDSLTVPPGSTLTPIPVDEALSSLSAILMDDAYYAFLQEGKRLVEGLPIVGAEHLIPLKASACLNLTQAQADGAVGLSRHIKKHRNDVFRLYRVVDPELAGVLPEAVRGDMGAFLMKVERERVELKALGFPPATKLSEILHAIRLFYRL